MILFIIFILFIFIHFYYNYYKKKLNIVMAAGTAPWVLFLSERCRSQCAPTVPFSTLYSMVSGNTFIMGRAHFFEPLNFFKAFSSYASN